MQLKIGINYISIKYNNEEQTMDSKSYNLW